MINRIQGIVQDSTCVLTTGGVGYEVDSLHALTPEVKVDLFTYAIYRETSASLYAFNTAYERNVFKELLKAQGAGPSVSMAMLRTLGVTGVSNAFATRDADALCTVSGIGKRTAEKMLATVTFTATPAEAAVNGNETLAAVQQILRSLQYKDTEIRDVLPRLDTSLTAEDATAAALKLLSERKTV